MIISHDSGRPLGRYVSPVHDFCPPASANTYFGLRHLFGEHMYLKKWGTGAQFIGPNISVKSIGLRPQLFQQHGQSIEEEVRQILRLTFADSSSDASGLGSKISKRFTEIGGVELPQPVHSLPRQSPNFDEAN
jgi:hypothetical protein